MSGIRRAALPFHEGTARTRTREVRGGKGAGLMEMVDFGLPVPPGFTIPTSISTSYLQLGHLPKRFMFHLRKCLAELETQTGQVLGSATRPLLVSVRSGGAVSMPGMMDTILNLGVTPEAIPALTYRFGERFAFDTWRRFLFQYGQLVLGYDRQIFDTAIYDVGGATADLSTLTLEQLQRLCRSLDALLRPALPDDPFDQLLLAVQVVMQSWQSERALAYRTAYNLPHWEGTAVNVQAMVFGNASNTSGTGVVFSHDVTTGEAGLTGEFLPGAQGEDVVSGTCDPLAISQMVDWNPEIYFELKSHLTKLSVHAGAIVDVEFTVENGNLFILQYRKATRSPAAAAAYAVQQYWAKRWTKAQAVKSLTEDDWANLATTSFDSDAVASATIAATGLPASPGAVVGVVATTCESAQALARSGQTVVLVRPDTTPSDMPGMSVSAAIVTVVGGATCHAAVVARGMNLPAVVGTGTDLDFLDGQLVSVDGTTGTVYVGELPLVGGDRPKCSNLILRWSQATAEPEHRVAFERIDEMLCANRVLNDFYLTDAMAQAARGTSAESRASDLRRQVHTDAAQVLALYLLLAISAEIRHYWDDTQGTHHAACAQAAELSLIAKYGRPTCFNRAAAQGSMLQVLPAASKADQAQYAGWLVTMFNHGFSGGSIGGPKWAAIAAALRDYLDGTLTTSVFVDHVFDLRHNGGRLFDKHRIFNHMTRDQVIIEQLDQKKHLSGVTQLHTGLFTVWFSDVGFSASVEELYLDGQLRQLW